MENAAETQDWLMVAEVDIVYRNPVKASQRPKVASSESAYQLLRSRWDDDKIDLQEQFKILLLNKANRALGIFKVADGGTTSIIVDSKLIFVAALKAAASSIILAHNHPSGNLKPSLPDRNITKQLVELGELLDISVLDHLIISSEGYYSFSDNGDMET